MEERTIAGGLPERRAGRRARALRLESGSGRFPILSLDPESCLIEAPAGAHLRGFADIFEGERHVATCLIVLAAPEGPYLRCAFKRRTIPRTAPPPDFAG